MFGSKSPEKPDQQYGGGVHVDPVTQLMRMHEQINILRDKMRSADFELESYETVEPRYPTIGDRHFAVRLHFYNISGGERLIIESMAPLSVMERIAKSGFDSRES